MKNLRRMVKNLKTQNFVKHGEAMKFPKSEHNSIHEFANTVIYLSKDSTEDASDLVANQYKGKKAYEKAD